MVVSLGFMLHRSTAIALLLAAALTAPAAFAITPAPMAGHCDNAAAAPAAQHDGTHHAAATGRGTGHGATAGPQDAAPCDHCAATTCLSTSHCAGGSAGAVAPTVALTIRQTALAIEPSVERRTGAEAHAPPTPPPLAGPIAS
jgi:hypothetical protein